MSLSDDFVAGPPARGADDIVPRPAEGTREPLLGTVRAALRGITALSPLPVGRTRFLWIFERPAGHGVADGYVCAWLAIVAVAFAVADGDAGPYAMGVALFRYVDLVATQAVVLLDPVGLRIGDPRRLLLLAGLHVVELTLIVGTTFRWLIGERAGSAVVTAVEVVTLQSRGRHEGNWIEAMRVLGAGGMALLAVVALVVIVRVARER